MLPGTRTDVTRAPSEPLQRAQFESTCSFGFYLVGFHLNALRLSLREVHAELKDAGAFEQTMTRDEWKDAQSRDFESAQDQRHQMFERRRQEQSAEFEHQRLKKMDECILRMSKARIQKEAEHKLRAERVVEHRVKTRDALSRFQRMSDAEAEDLRRETLNFDTVHA